MNRIPERNRPLVVMATGVVVLLLVAGGVLLVGTLAPSPSPTTSPSSSASAPPSVDPSTPEGGTRAFFEAFARARRTDDVSIVAAFVTGTQSSAYLTVDAFLRGQKDVGKASITTVLNIENVSVATNGDRSTVTFDFTEGGYDISLDTGKPLESPQVLPATRVTAQLELRDGRWLVDSFESKP